MQTAFDPLTGGNYESYLAEGSPELRLRQEQAVAEVRCSKEFLAEIQAMEESRTLAVFAETFCPDCVVTIPYIRIMERLQPRWNVRYFPRRGYEEFLRNLTGDAGIPTVLAYDDTGHLKKMYVEFPPELSKVWDTLEAEAMAQQVRSFRAGAHREILGKALLDLLR